MAGVFSKLNASAVTSHCSTPAAVICVVIFPFLQFFVCKAIVRIVNCKCMHGICICIYTIYFFKSSYLQ